MSEYRRTIVQTPKTYDQLNRNRPTRKRIYDYSAPPEVVNLPISSYQSHKLKQFSFERQNPISSTDLPSNIKQETTQRGQKKRISPEHKYDIGQRLNNITSIHDRISGALNRPRRQSKDIEGKISAQHLSISKEILESSKQPQSYTSRYLYEAENSNRSRFKPSYRSKYALDEQTITVPKRELASVKYTNQNEYTSRASRGDSIRRQFNSNTNTSKISDQYKISITPFKNQAQGLKERHPRSTLGQVDVNLIEEEYKKEKAMIQNMVLDKQIQQKRDKIFQHSPLLGRSFSPIKISPHKENETKTNSPLIDKFKEESEVMKLANALSRLVQVDSALFKLRQAFQGIKDKQKWQKLNSELHLNKVYMQQSVLKEFIKISIQEKDPFSIKMAQYSLNQTKDLAKLIGEAQELWNHQLYKCVSRQTLETEDFSILSIDFNSKGTIGLEDLTCFINVNSQNFFRSRDVATLYKRFLRLEGKTLEKASEGIQYGTFLERVAG